jgi:hypothetical protein
MAGMAGVFTSCNSRGDSSSEALLQKLTIMTTITFRKYCLQRFQRMKNPIEKDEKKYRKQIIVRNLSPESRRVAENEI